jgi:hypothetical protein
MKKRGLPAIAHLAVSADSMAWSIDGRMNWHHRRRQMCGGAGGHSGGCNNCSAWALQWREQVVASLGFFAEAAT